MKETTKYRIKHGSFIDWLQYKKALNFFGFRINLGWSYIPRPYYDKIHGRFDIVNWDTTICSFNRDHNKNSFNNFIEEYPNIRNYWPEYKKEQAELKEDVSKYWKEKNKRRGITKLN